MTNILLLLLLVMTDSDCDEGISRIHCNLLFDLFGKYGQPQIKFDGAVSSFHSLKKASSNSSKEF